MKLELEDLMNEFYDEYPDERLSIGISWTGVHPNKKSMPTMYMNDQPYVLGNTFEDVILNARKRLAYEKQEVLRGLAEG